MKINEEILGKKLVEAGIHKDDIWEVVESLTPFLNIIRKYDKKYLIKILGLRRNMS